jgi:hypothetical protein
MSIATATMRLEEQSRHMLRDAVAGYASLNQMRWPFGRLK